MRAIAIAAGFATMSLGCAKPPPIAIAGDPKLILSGEGRVKLAGFDERTGEFHDLGWFDAASLAGLTVADYDWKATP